MTNSVLRLSCLAFARSSALEAAISYSIPTLLAAHGPQTVPALASLSNPPLSPSALAQTLTLLASHGIFAYDSATGLIANNRPSLLLTEHHWTRWRLWGLLYPSAFAEIFRALPASLPAGEERSAMHIACGATAPDEPLYTLLARQPWADRFHEVLGAGAAALAPGLLADYNWSEIEEARLSVCDLGGGNGELLATLLGAHPRLKGAILELERTAEIARRNFFDPMGRFRAVRDRVVTVHVGDFFTNVPPYPVYTIRWTLHNWDDERAETILERAKEAIIRDAGCRLLIIDAVVTMARLSRPALYGSAVMMSGAKEGRERTEGEWRDLIAKSGWRLDAIYRLRNCVPSVLDLRLQ